MFKKQFAMCLLAAVVAAPVFAAAPDASMHEVYEAAQAGRLTEAQTMMQQVLKDHPNSAKAHFVEAELLGKQGQRAQAREELGNARRLEPGLPFAKPEAVKELERVLDGGAPASRGSSLAGPAESSSVAQRNGGQRSGGMSTGTIILFVLGFALVFGVIRMFRSRPQVQGYGAGAGSSPYGAPPQGYGAPPPAGGTGSGLLGSLASGAAMGAGVVAGEELVRHFMDRDEPRRVVERDSSSSDSQQSDTMGGQDFGISDNSSWDDGGSADGGSSGGDDWS